MYLSCLLIDVGDNPDRPRPGRLWLRNLYHVHQRLCMAFPSALQKEKDPLFLKPYQPCAFPDPRPERCSIDTAPGAAPRPCTISDLQHPIHVPRDTDHNFLFRIDPQPGGRVVILVQSAMQPDWCYAFQNADFLLACFPQVKELIPNFEKGQQFRFRILVNLSKKSKRADLRKPRDGLDKFGRQKDQGKRISLTWNGDDGNQKPEDVIIPWFSKKGEKAFELSSCNVQNLGWVVGYKPKKKETECDESEEEQSKHKMKFRSALLEGTLTVTDAQAFKQVITTGIGPAKAFGFGLLSLARLDS